MLKSTERELIHMHYVRGTDVRSAAAQLGRSPEAAYKSLQRVRRKLFDCIRRAPAPRGTTMTSTPNQLDELLNRMDRVCNGDAGPDDMARVEELARADEELCWAYICYSHLHAGLRSAPPVPPSSLAEKEAVLPTDQAFVSIEPIPKSTPASSSLPGFLSTTLHGTSGYFPEGMPLAYAIATIVTGLGILIGSVIHVAGPTEVARQSASLPSPLSPLPSVVGRITGLVDCTWEKKGLGIRDWGLEKGSGFRVQGSGETRLPSPNP